MRIAVLVVDGHRMMAEALTAGLAAHHDLQPVGPATSASQAVAIASSHRIDVAVIDTDLGHEDVAMSTSVGPTVTA